MLMLFGSVSKAENTMGIPQYATARSVKVCGLFKKIGTTCGTGTLLGNGLVLTEQHIIDKVSFNFVEISSSGLRLVRIEEDPIAVKVLRSNGKEFKDAVVVAFHKDKDLAILRINDDITPAIIFSDDFSREDSVWTVGNPGNGDFKAVKTKIVGIYLYKDGEEVRNLISIDSQNNQIRPGFSGGGLFNLGGGLIGIVEVCNSEEKLCAAIPSSYIKDWLKSLTNGEIK